MDDAGTAAIAERRRTAIIAGHRGDAAAARTAVADDAGVVRAAGLGALARIGALDDAALAAAATDADVVVRRRAATLSATHPGAVPMDVLLADADSSVVEIACWAAGEQGVATVGDAGIERLITIAGNHDDPLCRESAVAALGALGDERGLPAIIGGCTDKPAVRRRAVLALAPFDGPEVDAALQRALEDRDWQVRQAAEDLL